MGRNLWVNNSSFSQDFTVLIWDDLLGLFAPRPDPLTPEGLRRWLTEVQKRGAKGPIIYQIWRTRAHGWAESAVAHAWDCGTPIQVEACYDRLRVSSLERMPKLDYEPPEWLGAERFAEAFDDTPLSLQAQPIASFFGQEIEKLNEALGGSDLEFGIL